LLSHHLHSPDFGSKTLSSPLTTERISERK